MKAKDYLKQVEKFQTAINSKKEEIATLRYLVESTTAINTGEKVLSSEAKRTKVCGNGWTVDVIAHIFSYLKNGELF